jgi:EAL domain-containing protein (putative c-di-GMP-specific phosphodiesterase class I)
VESTRPSGEFTAAAVMSALPELVFVKIDQSFVAGMLDHVEDRAVVTAVIGLGAALGLRVVAEGIETSEQAAALARLGCHEGQGYLFGRPMPAEQARVWMRRSSSSVSQQGSGTTAAPPRAVAARKG